MDPMLSFGLRSVPKIFNAVVNALHWHLQQPGIPRICHYLDDYIIITPPIETTCREQIATLHCECDCLGVPIAAHKCEGPITCLTFLGIEIDTVAGQLHLPKDRLQMLLSSWGDCKHCSRKELESFVGLLNHACKVVRSGRSFLRRMINLLHAMHHPPQSDTPIHLNKGFRSDLAWWRAFVQEWNGISFLPPPVHLPQIHLYSDASGSWGCGAVCNGSWFQLPWDDSSHSLSIAEKELIPIILAVTVWGAGWKDHQIVCHCDNQAIVSCLQSQSSRHPSIMHLLRCLVFVEAHHHCHPQPIYIDTKSNHLADNLSQNNHSSFLSKVPGASRVPSPVPH